MIEFSLLLEHYLRTRKQADRDSWLSNRGKAAGRRAGEARGHELVANLGRAGCGIVQTVVTHLSPPRSPGPMGPQLKPQRVTSMLVRGVHASGGNERDSNPHLPLARRGLSQIELSSRWRTGRGRSRNAAQMAPGVGHDPTCPRFRAALS